MTFFLLLMSLHTARIYIFLFGFLVYYILNLDKTNHIKMYTVLKLYTFQQLN